MQLTRRKLAAVLTSGAALAPTAVLAQTAAVAQTPAAPPDDLLQAARDRNQANARALAAEPVPMATEPAFQFKA
ncbi:MAG TPA: hypothetical protein VNY05_34035 [Candidatus Acidoferrales bacterium]|jgi:hypothetical protein|nr:hypothetical protein [Candidatus Acidoferrales bacterium]